MRNFGHDLFLLMYNISQLNSEETIVRTYVGAIESLLPELKLKFIDGKEEFEGNFHTEEISTPNDKFGAIAFNNNFKNISKEEQSLLRNSIRMLALVLEKNLNDKLIKNKNLQLEKLVAERTLELSHNRNILENAQKIANIGSWYRNLSNKTQFWSDNLMSLFDIAKNEFPENLEDFLQYIHEEDRNNVVQIINDGIKQGKGWSHEYRIVKPGGEVRWIYSIAEIIQDNNGKVSRIYGTIQDITDRKKAEAKTKENELKLKSYFDNAPYGVFIANEKGQYLEVNKKACKITGYSENELLSMSIPDIVPPNLIEKALGHFRLTTTVGSASGDGSFVHKSGKIREWIVDAVKLNDTRFLGFVQDITDKKLEADRFRLLAENTVDIIWKTDMNFNFEYVSPSVHTMLGYTPNEWIGHNLKEFLSEEKFQEMANVNKELLSKLPRTDAAIFETEFLTKDGKSIHLEISCKIFADANGTPLAVHGATRDITERKASEKEKKKLEWQLNQAQKMEAIGRLAGGIAHDFNNLLTGITGNIALTKMDISPNDPIVETLNEVEEAADKAANLTKQLLAFSRKQIIEPKVMNPNSLLQHLEKMLGRLIGEDIDLVWELDQNAGCIKVDQGQIEQVIINMAINARDAMPDGGKITIETGTAYLDKNYLSSHPEAMEGQHVIIAVSDNGHGMDSETTAKIFEPFFTTKKENEGTGLGLATSFGIIKQHNGSIEVYSELNQGTTFKIYLPLIEEQAGKSNIAYNKKRLPTGVENILVVEDDDLVRTIAIRILQRQGYHVYFAGSGKEAIDLIEKENLKLDLLMTDIVMPNMNGRQLANILTEKIPNLKVLYTSGYTENVIAHHGVLDEGVNFISKPYSPMDLAKKVRLVLDIDEYRH